jgi:predicted O-linked N-acetylglucosamine transferase (SPINDLY family)
VFCAPRVQPANHLARHRLANLFLDTLPYNAHTTASDALWACVPLVTCRGSQFDGGVAASLLATIGLPELVTETLEDYEALALDLARDPQRRRGPARQAGRKMALFAAIRYRPLLHRIELAYLQMVNVRARGLPPGELRHCALMLCQPTALMPKTAEQPVLGG